MCRCCCSTSGQSPGRDAAQSLSCATHAHDRGRAGRSAPELLRQALPALPRRTPRGESGRDIVVMLRPNPSVQSLSRTRFAIRRVAHPARKGCPHQFHRPPQHTAQAFLGRQTLHEQRLRSQRDRVRVDHAANLAPPLAAADALCGNSDQRLWVFTPRVSRLLMHRPKHYSRSADPPLIYLEYPTCPHAPHATSPCTPA